MHGHLSNVTHSVESWPNLNHITSVSEKASNKRPSITTDISMEEIGITTSQVIVSSLNGVHETISS